MVHACRRCDRSNATMAARVNGVAERRPGRQHGAALARVAILETVMPWRSMCVAMTASVRFRVTPTPPSSAIHADRRAERPSINEKLVAPERTKSNIPAAFLTFLFTRLHADAEPKAKKQEISLCSNCSVWRAVGAEVLVPCRSRVVPTRRADRIRLRVPRLGQFSHTRRDIATMKMTSAGAPGRLRHRICAVSDSAAGASAGPRGRVRLRGSVARCGTRSYLLRIIYVI